MSTPRRRPTGGIRRPQVAGRPRTGHGENEPDGTAEETTDRPGGVAVDERGAAVSGPGRVDAEPAAPVRTGPSGDDRTGTGSGGSGGTDVSDDTGASDGPGASSDTDGAEDRDAAEDADGAQGTGRRGLRLPAPPRTRRATALLLAATVLLTAAAAFFAVQWASAEFSGSASNTALTDVGRTAEVGAQVGEAVTKVYSFDHARLQQAEDDARAVITPSFQPEFDRIFGSVRQLAPQQQAVVTATIPKSAVASITGDRATVYVFVNQVIRRQEAGGPPQEGSAAARLRVDAEFVDGRWKIAAMTPA